MIIGYARVSTEEQNIALQLDALKAAGCEKIFTDHGVSGSITRRPGLEGAFTALKKGDKLVVWRLDRLGRSLIQLVGLLDMLGKRKIGFSSLNENIDTSSSGGRLVFHMMAALAEFERSLISERTKAGMAAARARGRHIGRRPTLTTAECMEVRRVMTKHRLSLKEVASRYDVKPRTLRRLLGVAACAPAEPEALVKPLRKDQKS